MELLGSVLGVALSNLDSNSKPNDQEKDIFNEFISKSKKTKELSLTDDIWDELNSLNDSHIQIQNNLKDVIPPLREYMQNFNVKLSEYTRDLSLIRNKSAELKSLLEYNSKRLSNVSPLVNDLIIPPSVVNEIISGKIDSAWQENIAFIRDKKEIYKKYMDGKGDPNIIVPKDFDQLCQLLENLEMVILERSKKFIIHRIKALRSFYPIPSQKIQKEMIQVKDIFAFIVENNYSLSLELRQAYAYTMKWYYKNYFARYIRSLTILQFRNIDSQYALGNGLTNTSINYLNGYAISNYLSATYSKGAGYTTDESIQDFFQIDKRLSVLTQEDNTVMVSQIAENNTMENFIEVGFKNLNLAVLDNANAEFKFLNEFFQIGKNHDELKGILEQIFQPTLDGSLEYTKNLIVNTYDIFGVLINIRIAQQLQFESEQREVPLISEFMNIQLISLWPKFQQLIDFQCESLRNVVVTTTVAKLNVSNPSNNDPLTTPHELTLQFSKFLTSLLILAITHMDGIDERSEPLYNSIIRIRHDFESVMTKCGKISKSQERFLATNYMYLCNILQKQNLKLEDNEDGSLPLIIQETEQHYLTLVHAFSKVNRS